MRIVGFQQTANQVPGPCCVRSATFLRSSNPKTRRSPSQRRSALTRTLTGGQGIAGNAWEPRHLAGSVRGVAQTCRLRGSDNHLEGLPSLSRSG